jgi:hypothetical protein
MKPLLSLVLIASASLASGCVRHYNITLTNNNVMSTNGKPKYDPATDSYKFKDAFGRPATVPAFRIKEIAPQ